MNYRSYCLGDKSKKYVEREARKIPMGRKCLPLQMKSKMFGCLKSINNLSFLNYSKLTCDTSRRRESAPMWLLYLFMKKSASAVVNTWTS